MKPKNTHSVDIPLRKDSFETAIRFIEEWMQSIRMKRESIMETMLLVEALFNHLIKQGYNSDTMLMIRAQRSFGESSIKIGFEGKAYVPIKKNQEDISPELSILEGFSEKIDFRYRMGYNRISIVVMRHYTRSLIQCMIGILLAILVYIPIQMFVGIDERIAADQQFVLPMVSQFANAILMVGALQNIINVIGDIVTVAIEENKENIALK